MLAGGKMAKGSTEHKWHYAICNELFGDRDLRETASFARELGYEGLELAPFTLADKVTDLTDKHRRQIREEIESEGIKVVGLHWLLAKTEGLQINDPDPTIRERTAQFMLEEIDLCADLGGEVLVLGSPQQRAIRPGFTRDEAWTNMIEIMHRCGERAAKRGVFFCIEALPTPECEYINTVDMCAELVRQVGHSGFQMMVDCKQMATNDARPIPSQIKTVAPYIKHVHVNDPNRLGPGMGETDFRPILQALREIGFNKWCSVEAFDPDSGIEQIARESIQNLRAAE
jgi:sugar phosphate isomerase/epimerase